MTPGELERRFDELDARARRTLAGADAAIVRATMAIVCAEALLQNRDTSRRHPERN